MFTIFLLPTGRFVVRDEDGTASLYTDDLVEAKSHRRFMEWYVGDPEMAA